MLSWQGTGASDHWSGGVSVCSELSPRSPPGISITISWPVHGSISHCIHGDTSFLVEAARINVLYHLHPLLYPVLLKLLQWLHCYVDIIPSMAAGANECPSNLPRWHRGMVSRFIASLWLSGIKGRVLSSHQGFFSLIPSFRFSCFPNSHKAW